MKYLFKMERQKKKLPQDYPQFAFRLPESSKRKLIERLDRLKRAYNRNADGSVKVINKNDILLQALEHGLEILERKTHR